MIQYPLPTATASLLQTKREETRNHRGQLRSWSYVLNEEQSNLLLAFHRFVPQDPGNPYQGHATQYLTTLQERWNAKGPCREAAEAAAARSAALIQSLQKDGWHTATLDLQTEWRLIVGLGYQNALEIGMTLHPVYGFPYIPGTAVKGVARAWAEVDEADSALIRRVFGSETKRDDAENQLGGVRFFDALPATFPKLAVDIMNPHYPDYYANQAVPGDWQDPKPIAFLTVATGNRFRFALAAREVELCETASKWLQCGLTELGIGGKTSAGYGYFTEARAQTSSSRKAPAERRVQPTAEPDQPQSDQDRLAAWTGKLKPSKQRKR